MLTRIDGHLHLDGLDVVDLADRHGTPLFVYSAERIRENIAALRRAAEEHPHVTVAFATKACSLLAVLRLIDHAGCAFEVNSDGELLKVLHAGVDPAKIVANGVARPERELATLAKAGVRAINIDSVSQLRRLIALGIDTRIALRITPEIDARTTPGTDTASARTKFGLTADEMGEALTMIDASESIALAGLHVHVGSQITDLSVYEAAGRFAAQAVHDIGRDLAFVNVGGGFAVDYAHDELDLPSYLMAPPIGDQVSALLGPLAAGHPHLEVIIEPGRAVVGNAAILLTTVEAEKRRPDTHWLFLDAGYHTLIESFTYKWYFHLAHAHREIGQQPFKVVGPLCDSGDSFSDVDGEGLVERLIADHPGMDRAVLESGLVRLPSTRRLPHETAVGDVLTFLDTGAYTQDQIFGLNGRGRPAVVMLDGGEPRLIRSADTVDQLWLNEHE